MAAAVLFAPLCDPLSGHAQDMPEPAPVLSETPEDSLRCMTLAIAYEAANQAVEGRQAVAEVVLNRVAHPAFPKSVCAVVFEGAVAGRVRHGGCQFSFVCDGAVERPLSARVLDDARGIARDALSGAMPRRLPGALNYHANYVNPVWAARLDRVARIGAHIFYRPHGADAPETGRWHWRGDDPDWQLIRRYARYFDAAAPAPVMMAASPAAAAPAAPFAPWGLALVIPAPHSM